MNAAESGQILLANALRRLVSAMRETRLRVLATAASGTSDEEAVHDFRVALRRSRTLLRVAQNIWSPKRVERLEHDLRYYARTTGPLRDDEVLRSMLMSLPPTETSRDEIEVWLAKRARTGRTRHRAIFRTVREGPSLRDQADEKGKSIRPLVVVFDKLERLLADPPKTQLTAEELARVSVEDALQRVRRAADADVNDAEGMHSLRIRQKRLRYTVELFSRELGEVGARLIAHATRMQKRLGDLHDVDEAMATITRARGLEKSTQLAIVEALRAVRVACAVKVEPLLIEARQLQLPLVLSCNESSPNSAT